MKNFQTFERYPKMCNIAIVIFIYKNKIGMCVIYLSIRKKKFYTYVLMNGILNAHCSIMDK